MLLKYSLIVGLGGALGSISRYLIQYYFQNKLSTTFPLSTILVNIIGSFIIGIVFALADKGNVLRPEIRLLIAVGFCGGFTTFSTFSLDVIYLLKSFSAFYIAVYIASSVVLSVLAAYAGIAMIKQF